MSATTHLPSGYVRHVKTAVRLRNDGHSWRQQLAGAAAGGANYVAFDVTCSSGQFIALVDEPDIELATVLEEAKGHGLRAHMNLVGVRAQDATALLDLLGATYGVHNHLITSEDDDVVTVLRTAVLDVALPVIVGLEAGVTETAKRRDVYSMKRLRKTGAAAVWTTYRLAFWRILDVAWWMGRMLVSVHVSTADQAAKMARDKRVWMVCVDDLTHLPAKVPVKTPPSRWVQKIGMWTIALGTLGLIVASVYVLVLWLLANESCVEVIFGGGPVDA